MAKRIPCAGKAGACENRAALSVQAFGRAGGAWTQQFYCTRCAGRIIRLRGKLIKRHNLNVVVRPITDRDRVTVRARKRKD